MPGAKPKRQKTSEGASAPIIRPSLVDDPSQRQTMAAAYRSAAPYPHCVIPDICAPEALLKVRNEIIDNIEATYKETDLFKMLQTGDLANMDKLDAESAAKLPTLLALRNAIYSPEFRQFVSDITGCGELSDKTDCACNIHPFGGHLLCHDDVIGDRRVSYIIYLTDPEDPWTAADGGALELYPECKETPNAPGVIPTATALPIWNTMAMFKVLPGRSFHSIQEVFTTEKPRMSIQGWFHSDEPPSGAEMATLRQLQACPGEDDALERFQPLGASAESAGGGSSHPTASLPTSAEPCPSDIALLARWVNPAYLDPAGKAADKIQARFQEDGSVQLLNFLCQSKADEIAAAIVAADAADAVGGGKIPAYDAGIGGGWTAVGPCHKQRYMQYNGGTGTEDDASPASRAGALLRAVQEQLFASTAFSRLMLRLTTLTLTHHRSEARRFRPGLDYTVAHYGCLTKDPRLDAVLCFVDNGAEGSAEAWEGGEMGGYEAYLLAEEDEEKPAEVYRAPGDNDTGVLNVSPAFNTLSLVLRDEGLMRFVKYLSAQAPGSRWDVSAVYVPEDDSDEEEEGEGVKKEDVGEAK